MQMYSRYSIDIFRDPTHVPSKCVYRVTQEQTAIHLMSLRTQKVCQTVSDHVKTPL